MTKAKKQEILEAIRDYGNSEFDCGDWRYDEQDADTWGETYEKSVRAHARLVKLLGVA